MEDKKEQRNYIGYEYKEVVAEEPMLSLLLDGYENFGWEINGSLPESGMGESVSGMGESVSGMGGRAGGMGGRAGGIGGRAGGMGGRRGGSGRTVLRLRRDRKILNKAELTRLQRNFEACVSEIQTLEQRKTSKATVFALILGVIGTGFMAGSVFAVTAQPPRYILCILLAVPAFLGWILPCFLYKRIRAKQTEKLTPLIEAKYDEIYEICEKGNKLLY